MPRKEIRLFQAALKDYERAACSLRPEGAGLYVRLLSAVYLIRNFETFMFSAKIEPYSSTTELLEKHVDFIDQVIKVEAFLGTSNGWKLRDKKVRDPISVFSDLWSLYDSRGYQRHLKVVMERLCVNGITGGFLKGKRCLDVGCGSGVYTVACERMGASLAIGIDTGKRNIKFARQMAGRLNCRSVIFRTGNIFQIQFPNASFDLVICCGLLHHLQKPLNGLREIYRVLKPDGMMLMSVEGKGGILRILWDTLVRIFYNVSQHQVREALISMNFSSNSGVYFLDGLFASYYRPTHKDLLAQFQRVGFSSVCVLRGASKMDLVKKDFHKDPYFKDRFGEGNLRWLVFKGPQL